MQGASSGVFCSIDNRIENEFSWYCKYSMLSYNSTTVMGIELWNTFLFFFKIIINIIKQKLSHRIEQNKLLERKEPKHTLESHENTKMEGIIDAQRNDRVKKKRKIY